MNQFAYRADTAISQHIDIVLAADSTQHRQFIVVERVHVAHRDRVLVVERVDAEQFHGVAVFVQNGDFLHAGACQPQRNRLAFHHFFNDRLFISDRKVG